MILAKDGMIPTPPTPARRMPLRVVLVEHRVLLREALRALLESNAEVQVVGDAGNATEALAAIEALDPSAIITDLDLPGQSGVDLIATLRQRGCAVPILVLTEIQTEESLRVAMLAGASGFVLKDSTPFELVEGLRVVATGRKFFCKLLADRMLRRLPFANRGLVDRTAAHLMTRREREVLTRVALGQSNKIAARDLGLSVKTVEKHRSNLMRKLNLHNSAELTMFALRHGLVKTEGIAP